MSQVSPSAGQSRIFYLDTLRAFCMIYGILAHGSTISFAADAMFDTIRNVNDLFRMAVYTWKAMMNLRILQITLIICLSHWRTMS